MEMKYMVGRTGDIWSASLGEACMDPLDEGGKMTDAKIHDASSGDIFYASSDVIGREAFHSDEDIADPSPNVDEETFKPVDLEDDSLAVDDYEDSPDKFKGLVLTEGIYKKNLTNIFTQTLNDWYNSELFSTKQILEEIKELKHWDNRVKSKLHDEHLSVDDFNSPTTEQSSYKLLQYSIFLLIYLFKRILNLLCDRLRISKGSAYNHLVVIIKAKLSTDIEKNPGPIHERCYRAALNFCENASNINLNHLKNYVSNFLTTDEDFPEGFLCDDNVMIWLKVTNILDKINYQEKQLFDDIISLQRSWENSLSEKERAERAERAELAEISQCKCKIHGSSCPSMNGSPNMATHKEIQAESIILPALRAPVAAVSTPSPAVSSPSPAVSSPSPAVSTSSPAMSIETSLTSQLILSIPPTLPHQPLIENAATLKEETIEIFNTDVATGEFFKYGRFSGAKHGKFICQTDCEISPNRRIDLVKHRGISRESLINHARKYHSIKLDFQKKKAFFGEGSIKCSICDKSYTKKQALKTHLAKSHQDISRNDPTLQPAFPSSHTSPTPLADQVPVSVMLPTIPVNDFPHSAIPSGVPIPVTIQTPYPDMSSQTYQANNVQLVQVSTQYETVDQDTLMNFLETFSSSSCGVFSQESNLAQSLVQL